jgi:hypothetical protein
MAGKVERPAFSERLMGGGQEESGRDPCTTTGKRASKIPPIPTQVFQEQDPCLIGVSPGV